MMTTNCVKCQEKLVNFIAYLPNQGEVCISCYRDYAVKEEAKTLVKNPRTKNH